MSMNAIGKGLVVVHTAVSIVAMTWAAGLLLQFTDWGWKEPRTDLGQRLPSEYDKRAAAHAQALKGRDAVMFPFKPAQANLRYAELRFGDNHLFYVQELKRLKDAPGNLDVKMIKRDGAIVLDAPQLGRPVFDEKVDAIKKSYDPYFADLQKIDGDIKAELAAIAALTAENQKITFDLTAKEPATGKKVPDKIGIYDMLEDEKKAQDQARFEKEYLLPNWARSLEEAELFSDRRVRLEETLKRIRQGKGR